MPPATKIIFFIIRPFAKLAYSREFEGYTLPRTIAYFFVREPTLLHGSIKAAVCHSREGGNPESI
ncbi:MULTISPECIES: hypothetical protein [unclassified Rickettsia]|uniref:hypothetical protein n=1 Tax=unclassified Rickettsia TaxID=114295 RepID=UPI0031332CCF